VLLAAQGFGAYRGGRVCWGFTDSNAADLPCSDRPKTVDETEIVVADLRPPLQRLTQVWVHTSVLGARTVARDGALPLPTQCRL